MSDHSAGPSHGKCQSGRSDMTSHPGKTGCKLRALPGRTFCQQHQEEAYARLPDRSIGDRKPVRWSTWTTLSRGEG